MRMPSSVTKVSPVSGKLGQAPVLQTQNVEGSVSISPATLHREAGGFLIPL